MAQTTGFLAVKLKGQTTSFESSGLKVWQPVDAAMIAGDGILLDIKGDDIGWYYNSTTDNVFLITSDGWAVELVRLGDYWQWVVGASDLGSGATDPGSLMSKTAQIVVERTVGGVRSKLTSKDFALSVERQYGFVAGSIAGLAAHFDAYDLTEADAAVVTTWQDKGQYNRDVTEATNKPTKTSTGLGRPFVAFDGTNDLLTSTLADVGLACTAFVVAKIGSYDATTRGILQVGGTNGARLAFNSTNLKGLSGADVANTTLPALDAWFVAVITKTASGAITVQKGTAAAVSTASVAAVTAGTIGMGDTVADAAADVDVAEVIIYDSVLTATQIERTVRSLQNKWQATG